MSGKPLIQPGRFPPLPKDVILTHRIPAAEVSYGEP